MTTGLRATLAAMMAIAFVANASAAEVPPALLAAGQELSFQKIEELSAALSALNQGDVEQCNNSKIDRKDLPKDRNGQPICAFHKSPKLIKIIAANMVAIEAAEHEFKIDQSQVRLDVLSAAPAPGLTDEQRDQLHNVQYAKKMETYLDGKTFVSLLHFQMLDLDIGDAPDHNAVSPAGLAGLAPIIDDFPAP
jgi:hypothetical protein